MSAVWLQMELLVPAGRIEEVENRLLAAGAEAVSWLETEEAEPVFTQGQYWPRSRCQAIFGSPKNARKQLDSLLKDPDWQFLEPRIDELEEQDWVSRTQADFPVRQFGRLWIAPHWAEVPGDAIILRMEPGRAFGTGAHPTTALCLQYLEKRICGGESVVDYGCGSGILAIAALKLGAAQATGVDTDPVALQVARENAQQNSVDSRLRLFLPERDDQVPVRVLVANILAEPLVALAPVLAERVQEGGDIALSGVLHAQEMAVMAAYSAYFDFFAPQRDGDWSLLSGRRRKGVQDGNPVSAL